jgi:hypothetical protein
MMEYELADGRRSEITEVLMVRLKLLSFSWEFELRILKDSPFPIILGLDFMHYTEMAVDVGSRQFWFGFDPKTRGEFCLGEMDASRGVVGRDGMEPREREPGGLEKEGKGDMGLEMLKEEFSTLFSGELGTAKCAPYEIELSDSTPVRSPPYRCGPPKLRIFREVVDDLLARGVVRPSKSPYASPAFLLPKAEGGVRMVVDYRKVNSKIVYDSYPMPTIEQAFEQLGKAVVFSSFDLNSAYFQIPLSANSRRVTAFCTPFGLFEFNKLPMGVSVGCQGLSRVVDELFSDLKGKYIFNFLDDLVVYSESVEEHRKHVREVLSRLQGAGFTLNRDKVMLGATEIKYLGHRLSSEGVNVLSERVATIKEYPRPKTLRALRRFLGMVGFYARFIPEFADKSAVLHGLKRKGVPFVWEREHQEAFDTLKNALCEAPTLQLPDFEKEFVLVTDASDLAVAAVLHQRVEESLAPIAYYSRLLTGPERKYSTYKKECLAVLFGCEKCRGYLEHKEFELHCDNLALCWLIKRVNDVGRIGRWIVRLAPYKFKVKHVRGVDNVVAYALSRASKGEEGENPEVKCMGLLQSLPLMYYSLEEHQKGDSMCKELYGKIQAGQKGVEKFQICKGLVCYRPKARVDADGWCRRRWYWNISTTRC